MKAQKPKFRVGHRYYVQSETVRGERRFHWIMDGETDAPVFGSHIKWRVQARCQTLNEAALRPLSKRERGK